MDGAADAALGAWASVRGFFTPATLFLVVNLVIGTIALTSRSRRRGNNAHDDEHAPHRQHHHHAQAQAQQQQQQEVNQYYNDQHQQYVPAPLARTSSVLDRLRSIGLYRFRSGDFPPEYATPVGTDSRDATSAPAPAGGDARYATSRSDPAPAPRAAETRRPAPSRMRKSSISEARTAELPPARVVRSAALEDEDVLHYARADEFRGNNNDSFTAQQQQHQPLAPLQYEEEEEEHHYREEYVPPLRPAPLARAPSVLERLRSFGFSRFHPGDQAAEDAAAAVAELDRNHAQKQQYSRSRSEPSREQSKKGKRQQQESAEARMSKSGSVARKPVAVEAPAEAEGGVDARADDFINTFRKQLQLQRLNSLLNYKEMLNRGT